MAENDAWIGWVLVVWALLMLAIFLGGADSPEETCKGTTDVAKCIEAVTG